MKKLSREEMKKVMGGLQQQAACSMTYMGGDGQYHTEYGNCSLQTVNTPMGTTAIVPYCHTASFQTPVPLSSNHGVSGCGGIS